VTLRVTVSVSAVAPSNGTVSNAFRLIPAGEEGIELWLELEDGRRLRLDPQDPRSRGFAQVLSGLQQQRRPVYVESDPETSVVTALRIPHVSPVLALRAIGPGLLDVVLALSHARHSFVPILRIPRNCWRGSATPCGPARPSF
jgi:hypothetical protein